MLATLLEAGATRPGVDLTLALGPFRARISLCAHAVHDVSCGPFAGEDALFRLLLLPGRPVRQQPRVNAPDTPMLGDVGTLLFQFLAFETELERQALRLGGFDRVWRVRFAALKTILEGLPEDVKRVIRLCDGTRDVRHLCAEGPLAPTTTLRVLEKLLVDGVLVRADIADELAPVDDDGAISADRRWQEVREARASTIPSPAPLTTDTGNVESPAAPPEVANVADVADAAQPDEPISSAPAAEPMDQTADTVATKTPTTMTTTAPGPPAHVADTSTPNAAATSPAPTRAATSGSEAIAAAHRHAAPSAMVSGESALPRKTPRLADDLQAWLGEESAFFADSVPRAPTPRHTPWPLWQLAALMVGGGVLGGLLAHACG